MDTLVHDFESKVDVSVYIKQSASRDEVEAIAEKIKNLESGSKISVVSPDEGLIDLYYGDESHICTEGYVPYGWQFRGEDVYIPSERGVRLNVFGMIDRNNHYEGFSTTENMTAEKIADFIDRLD